MRWRDRLGFPQAPDHLAKAPVERQPTRDRFDYWGHTGAGARTWGAWLSGRAWIGFAMAWNCSDCEPCVVIGLKLCWFFVMLIKYIYAPDLAMHMSSAIAKPIAIHGQARPDRDNCNRAPQLQART